MLNELFSALLFDRMYIWIEGFILYFLQYMLNRKIQRIYMQKLLPSIRDRLMW